MKREIVKLIAAVGFTLSVLAAFCAWSYFQEQQRLFNQIDKRLYAAATAIAYVLKDDFHDRATAAGSITPEEDQNNIHALSALNTHLEMKFLYTVTRDRDGTYRLTSSSATDEELRTGEEVRYFTAYPDASALLKQSLKDHNTHFSKRSEAYYPVYAPVYSDRWGTYRSVFIPMLSPSGTQYAACADVDISYVTALLRQNLLQTLLEFVIFALAILPIIYAYLHAVKRKSREYQQVHQLYLDHSERSVTDQLTQIGNRLKLDNELQAELGHYQHHRQPFGLVMIDIDYFKTINDQHGHQVGDIVLQQFARLLVEHSRANDVVGRWGGEEFMIIYRSTTLDGAYHHAEKLRKIIETTVFEKEIHLSASFGVTQPSKDITLAQLIQCVDDALYTAKNEGRNSIVTHPCDK